MQQSTPSVSPGHAFSRVPQADINRSSFDRTSTHKTTFDAGYLVPFFVDEAMPGDTFNMSPTFLARLATPLKAVMDEMYMDIFFFSVPLRLIWDNFPKFMGEQINPGDSISYVIPMQTSPGGGYGVGTLQDYMGLVPGVAGYTHSALPGRAYNLVFNTWFRDQNLINSAVVDKGDAGGSYTDYVLRRRGKRHDYFTSALPFPQKGSAVTLPLGTTAPVIVNPASTNPFIALNSTTHAAYGIAAAVGLDAGSAPIKVGSAVTYIHDPNGSLIADLSTATAATINSIRTAVTIQQLLERDARGGTRLTEIIHSHFGVVSPDARMQRPEYLGGGSVPVIINPVASTAPVGGYPSVIGTVGAFGTAINPLGSLGFVQSFTEHCVLLGLVSVRAAMTYQQGIARMWSRSTRYDFYFPVFANLGEQTVLNKEIYVQGSGADAAAFGYQERWAELRYKPSLITGLFRSSAAGTLDFWHLSQSFGSLPALGQSFIEENPPVDRVVWDPSQPHFIFDSYLKLNCVRPMPVFSVPGLRSF